MNIVVFTISICLAFCLCSSSLIAQLKIPLKFDDSKKSSIGKTLLCDKDFNCGLPDNIQEKSSLIDELNTLIKIRRVGKDFYIKIDSNQNGKLADEKEILLKPESTAILQIRKKTNNRQIFTLPFEISHTVLEKNEQRIDRFNLTPSYAFSGVLNYGNCNSNLVLSDMNYDGKVDFTDSGRGTNLLIDINNDGKFWGKEEHNKATEIIKFCNQKFVVSYLNNSQLVLEKTDLQLAEIGKQVPDFSISLLNGQIFNPENLKRKVYVLDFWASWCVPCVNNLPEILKLKKDYENRIEVFSINVDKFSRRSLAEKIIKEKRIYEISAIRGLGEDDKLWKTFGGTNQNKLSIPLYVLIDENGIVKYADNGGENLAELRKNIEELF